MSEILRREQLAILMACFGHVITVVSQETKRRKHLDCQKLFSAVSILGSISTAFGPPSCRKN